MGWKTGQNDENSGKLISSGEYLNGKEKVTDNLNEINIVIKLSDN